MEKMNKEQIKQTYQQAAQDLDNIIYTNQNWGVKKSQDQFFGILKRVREKIPDAEWSVVLDEYKTYVEKMISVRQYLFIFGHFNTSGQNATLYSRSTSYEPNKTSLLSQIEDFLVRVYYLILRFFVKESEWVKRMKDLLERCKKLNEIDSSSINKKQMHVKYEDLLKDYLQVTGAYFVHCRGLKETYDKYEKEKIDSLVDDFDSEAEAIDNKLLSMCNSE